MALASTAVCFAAAFAVSAPFLALTYVDFAPDIVFDDPLALAAVQLAVFVLATSRVPALGAASVSVVVWLVHGFALRKITYHKKGAMRQTFAGGEQVPGSCRGGVPRQSKARLSVPAPPS